MWASPCKPAWKSVGEHAYADWLLLYTCSRYIGYELLQMHSWNRSVKKFIIDQGIPWNVSLYEEVSQVFYNQPTDDHGDHASDHDAVRGDVENVDEVDDIDQQS